MFAFSLQRENMMRTCWAVAPYDSEIPDVFQRAWSYDLGQNVIAIGWSELGNPMGLSRAELEQRASQTWPDDLRAPTRATSSLWPFLHKIQVGDMVVARRGVKTLIGIGSVTRPAYFDEAAGQQRTGFPHPWATPNFLGVEWLKATEFSFPQVIFSRRTVSRIVKHFDLINGLI
jgi:hypothetical protein